MMTRIIIYFAYYLKSSKQYNTSKQFLRELMENENSQIKVYFDRIMMAYICFSIYMIIYDIGHQNNVYSPYIETGVFIVFSIEYLLRLWLCSDTHEIIIEKYEKAQYLNIQFDVKKFFKIAILKKFEYLLSPYAIIDLLAILPSYQPANILRIFLIFRIFKLFRYSRSTKLYANVLASKRFELLTLLLFTGFILLIASTSVYFFEFPESKSGINNLFEAFYWSIVTLATVGYGDIVPNTLGGRVVAMLLIFTSICILAFFTSILIAAFNEKMPEIRENKISDELKHYKEFVIICGFGRVGQEIAMLLTKDKQKFIIIDKDENNINLARKLKYLAIHNDATRNEVLISAGINHGAKAILCITGDDVVNVYVTLSSRHLNKNIHIISRVSRHDNRNKMYQAGADNVILPFEVAGLLAAEFPGQPVAFEAISGILQNQTDIVMETILVNEKSSLDSAKIGELDLQQRKMSLLGVISANPIHLKHKNKYQVKQQHFYFNPEPHFVLRQNDMLVILGRKYSIEHFRNHIEQQRLLNKGKS